MQIMQKKILVGVVILGVLVFVFFTQLFGKTDTDKKVTDLLPEEAVEQQQENGLIADKINSFVKTHSLDSTATDEDLDNVNKRKIAVNSVRQGSKKKIEISSKPSERKLENAMQEIPINYHSVLYSKHGQDQELIDDYSKVVENVIINNDDIISENSGQSLSNFIYQHELSTEITLEYLDCNLTGCIIYGVELQSGVWSQLIGFAQNQSWWAFSKVTTRNSLGAEGNLIFFTVIR